MRGISNLWKGCGLVSVQTSTVATLGNYFFFIGILFSFQDLLKEHMAGLYARILPLDFSVSPILRTLQDGCFIASHPSQILHGLLKSARIRKCYRESSLQSHDCFRSFPRILSSKKVTWRERDSKWNGQESRVDCICSPQRARPTWDLILLMIRWKMGPLVVVRIRGAKLRFNVL